MSEKIKFYSDDYSEVLFETDDRVAAHQFFYDSGKDSMPLVIDFGKGWRTRWGGRLELKKNYCISYVAGSEYLNYMILWPNPDLAERP